jgi:hypothetical protein
MAAEAQPEEEHPGGAGPAFLGLRPFASLIDGAIADAYGVRVAGIALSIRPRSPPS